MKRKSGVLAVVLSSAIVLPGCGLFGDSGDEPAETAPETPEEDGADEDYIDEEETEDEEEIMEEDPEQEAEEDAPVNGPIVDEDIEEKIEEEVNGSEEDSTDEDEEAQEEEDGAEESNDDASEEDSFFGYTSEEFGFSVEFPEHWDGLIEYDEEAFGGQMEGALNVSYVPNSEIDQPFFSIIVLPEDMGEDYLAETPWIFLTSSDEYNYAYTLAAEPVEAIMEPENEEQLQEFQSMMNNDLPEMFGTFTLTKE
ncbi:hypothetical protein CR205_16105 [Alteribacter lacisalsi]|uniref:Uncharacterized protein n=1 Tax=Alteribacter lacisalsi TaxID=2045244 RepID=A0A2W0H4E0_9BACI|nr:hypothetical protein [Alteribacter lacisalsi]PYZ95901.1 hypothetical protein CR205_16105 [Alteribacter lacisalsi]